MRMIYAIVLALALLAGAPVFASQTAAQDTSGASRKAAAPASQEPASPESASPESASPESAPQKPASHEQAKKVVEKLDATLLDVMQNAADLGYAGRYNKLRPVVTKVFDLPQIAHLAVRGYWDKFSDSQKKTFLKAFKKLSIDQYASRFDDYEGETIHMLGVAKMPGGALLVKTEIVPEKKDDAVTLAYALRKDGEGNWRIVNVIAKGVSNLALKRSQYEGVLKKQGVDAFIERIEKKAAALPDA